MKSQYILTDRLQLREITEDDTEQIILWRSNQDIYKYFGSARAITEEEHLRWYKKYVYNPNIKHFIAVEIATQRNVGLFGVKKSENHFECAEISSCILDPDERGKGFAQEATNAMVEYAVKMWNAKKIIAIVHRDNVASKKMFERCGFQIRDNKELFYSYERDICYT